MYGLAPLIAFLFFSLLLFGLIAYFRYLRYRETLALAEKGLVRPGPERRNSSADSLKVGIVFTALGLALCLGLYPLGLSSGANYVLGLGPWMLVGFVPLFIGVALILIYVLMRKDESSKPPAEKPSEKGDS